MSSIKLYNTLSRKIEEFTPIIGKKVKMFVCGPTVYDFSHLGHAKTYTQFDFIARYLRYRGYELFYLQNITDIDDKIIKRSAERGKSWRGLADEFTKKHVADMKALGNNAVTEFARATDYIPQIVTQVKTLLEKGFAYKTSDGIYYDISKFKDYGKLSKRTEVDQNAGVSRIDEGLDKKNKNDFCLWKFFREGEPFWETELGKGQTCLPAGRPGWHIEDTAITEHFFGPQYDIHGGAVDLIFPHHEAEIAQMEAASGKAPLVKYWLHTGFLNINSEKMSKSLGNFKTIREVLKDYDHRVLRFFFISSHYRATLDFAPEFLDQAKEGLKRIDDFVGSVDKNYDDEPVEKIRNFLVKALDNDFDTPAAMAILFDFIREQNKNKPGKHVWEFLQELNQIFGFLKLEKAEMPEKIKRLIDERNKLRTEKNFALADKIRDQIIKMGYTVNDAAQ